MSISLLVRIDHLPIRQSESGPDALNETQRCLEKLKVLREEEWTVFAICLQIESRLGR